MKKVLFTILCLVIALSLASCKKKTDTSGTFEIYSQEDSKYTLKYVAKELKFGDLFLVISEEKLVEFYTKYDANTYKIEDYYIRIGEYSISLDVVEETTGEQHFYPVDADGNRVSFNLLKSVDSEGYETANTFTIKIYVCYEDKDNVHVTTTAEPEDTTETTVTDENGDQITVTTEAVEVPTTEVPVADSSIAITTNPTDLLKFIRGKDLNTKAEEK